MAEIIDIHDSKPKSSRYEFGEEIGSGDWGRVYYATDSLNPRDSLAIKVLRPNQYALEKLEERGLTLEELARRELIHTTSDNIVPRWLDSDDDGNLLICMHLYDVTTTRTLSHYLWDKESNPEKRKHLGNHLDLEEIVKISSGILNGVKSLHKKAGRVHRDIKASNVVFDNHMDPMLIDFGGSDVPDIGYKSIGETIVGTRGNVGHVWNRAPEGFGDDGRYNFHSDVWSVGMLMYRMFTGEYMFENDFPENNEGGNDLGKEFFDSYTDKELRKLIGKRINRQVIKGHIPIYFRDFMKKALDPSPYERFSDAEKMLNSLNNITTVKGFLSIESLKEIGGTIRKLGLGAAAAAVVITGLLATNDPGDNGMISPDYENVHIVPEFPENLTGNMFEAESEIPKNIEVRSFHAPITHGHDKVMRKLPAPTALHSLIYGEYRVYYDREFIPNFTKEQQNDYMERFKREETDLGLGERLWYLKYHIDDTIANAPRDQNGRVDLEDVLVDLVYGSSEKREELQRITGETDFWKYITARKDGEYVIPHSYSIFSDSTELEKLTSFVVDVRNGWL